MKTLVITSRNDFRIHALMAPLRGLMEVGFIAKYDSQTVVDFGADLIFTDEPEKSPNGYDLNRISSIRPFINLSSYVDPSPLPKYESDVSYIGPISDMDSVLLDIYRLGYNVRNFFGSASLLPCYSGSVQIGECWPIYRTAKVSPVPKTDVGYRELDIIAAGGNPLRFTSKEDFISEVIKGINGKKFKHIMSKSQIFSNNTNFDRLAQVVSDLGFSAVAKKILEDKKCLV
jgi:hypothetical protein